MCVAVIVVAIADGSFFVHYFGCSLSTFNAHVNFQCIRFVITATEAKNTRILYNVYRINECDQHSTAQTAFFFIFVFWEKAIKQSFICICTLKREQMTGECTKQKVRTPITSQMHTTAMHMLICEVFLSLSAVLSFRTPNRITKNTSKMKSIHTHAERKRPVEKSLSTALLHSFSMCSRCCCQ